MYLIKSCPSCGRKLRFPIDKGKITVKCPCGHNFTADPDDTLLYNNSKFDLSDAGVGGHKRNLSRNLSQIFNQIKPGRIYSVVINGLYNFKYKLQNYKMLSSSERRGMSIILFAILIVIAIIYYLLVSA